MAKNEPTDMPELFGETTFLKLLREGVANRIVSSLRAREGWPFDLSDGTVDKEEEIILNLWGFAAAVMRTRFSTNSGTSVAAVDERRTLLNRFYDFFWTLVAEGLSPPLVRKTSGLTVGRHIEYDAAFNEWMKLQENHDRVPVVSFMRLVTKNLFGRESDNVSVPSVVGAVGVLLMSHEENALLERPRL
jgi:hypothetical protein